jgi:hypothetical protein
MGAGKAFTILTSINRQAGWLFCRSAFLSEVRDFDTLAQFVEKEVKVGGVAKYSFIISLGHTDL